MVSIGGASNADVQPLHGSTLLAAAPRQSGSAALPVFGFVPNQVAYPPGSSSSSSGGGDDVSDSGAAIAVPVQLLSGRVSQPATLRWVVLLLAGSVESNATAEQFLPAQALSGYLVFTPDSGRQQLLELPIDWSQVPPEAEYRIGGWGWCGVGLGVGFDL